MTSPSVRATNRRRFLQYLAASPLMASGGVVGADQHPGRTEAALQRVLGGEGGAQGRPSPDRHRSPRWSGHRRLQADGEGDAGRAPARRRQHGAGAADALLAAEMRPGQTQLLAQEIGEALAGLDEASTRSPLTVSAIAVSSFVRLARARRDGDEHGACRLIGSRRAASDRLEMTSARRCRSAARSSTPAAMPFEHERRASARHDEARLAALGGSRTMAPIASAKFAGLAAHFVVTQRARRELRHVTPSYLVLLERCREGADAEPGHRHRARSLA